MAEPTFDFNSLDAPIITEIPDIPSEESEDVGECAVCGNPTYRPPGVTPKGRRKRLPKYCVDHAGGGHSAPSPNRRTRKRGNVDIADSMTELHAAVGGLMLMRGDELGAVMLGRGRMEKMAAEQGQIPSKGAADDIGQAWGKMAEAYPGVEKTLAGFFKTSVGAELVMAYSPFLIEGARRRQGKVRLKNPFARFRRRKDANEPEG